MWLGIGCLNGCAVNEPGCPPFPFPNATIVEELKECPLENMPFFYDWLNKLFVLEQQLNV